MAFWFYFFDDFEVLGFLGGPKSAREALGGRFGRVLGGPGGPGESGGHLGRLLGGLGAVLEAILRQDDF